MYVRSYSTAHVPVYKKKCVHALCLRYRSIVCFHFQHFSATLVPSAVEKSISGGGLKSVPSCHLSQLSREQLTEDK